MMRTGRGCPEYFPHQAALLGGTMFSKVHLDVDPAHQPYHCPDEVWLSTEMRTADSFN